jgi:hypothetical protein
LNERDQWARAISNEHDRAARAIPNEHDQRARAILNEHEQWVRAIPNEHDQWARAISNPSSPKGFAGQANGINGLGQSQIRLRLKTSPGRRTINGLRQLANEFNGPGHARLCLKLPAGHANMIMQLGRSQTRLRRACGIIRPLLRAIMNLGILIVERPTAKHHSFADPLLIP